MPFYHSVSELQHILKNLFRSRFLRFLLFCLINKQTEKILFIPKKNHAASDLEIMQEIFYLNDV